MTKYWGDYEIGEKWTSPGKTITEGTISVMLGLGGYVVPFFLDEEYAKTTVYGGRIVPGRLTLLMMDGLSELTNWADYDTMIAMMGLDNIRFRAPLRAGDTIRLEVETTDKRETKRPERGLIMHREVCKNQRGETIAEVTMTHLVQRKLQ